MNFFEFLDKLKQNYNSIILYCLLDRIPIIVFGGDTAAFIDDRIVSLWG